MATLEQRLVIRSLGALVKSDANDLRRAISQIIG